LNGPTNRGVAKMDWQFELDGKSREKQRLRSLALAYNCTVRPGPAGTFCLGGDRFSNMATPQEALADAATTLARLNGLARLENPEHYIVYLGNDYYQDRIQRHVKPHPVRSRYGQDDYEFVVTLPGMSIDPHVPPADAKRREAIMADSKLVEILEAFAAEEMTWQRLRVAFERIGALVGKGDNALVKHKYATQDELTNFKKNAEDPRHTGHDAVHGVPRGELRGTKMTESEGLNFVRRLFNDYVEKKYPLSKRIPDAKSNHRFH
jgi:hypothetical protein